MYNKMFTKTQRENEIDVLLKENDEMLYKSDLYSKYAEIDTALRDEKHRIAKDKFQNIMAEFKQTNSTKTISHSTHKKTNNLSFDEVYNELNSIYTKLCPDNEVLFRVALGDILEKK